MKDQTSTVNEVALTTEPEPFALAQYRNSDNKIELTLYRTVGNAKVVDDTYTITVNTVDKYTSTNLDPDGFVFDQKGVYSATVDNINGVVNVVLARNTKTDSIALDQNNLDATMKVSTLENATIKGETTAVVGADNGDSFTVYSEDGKNHRTFTVKATYLDAMSSLTITGTDGNDYTGTPVDTNYDDIADTITVTLPASAVVDGYGEIIANPTLAVSYEAEGHNNTVEIGTTNESPNGALNNVPADTDVKNGESVTFTGLGSGTSSLNYVLVTRLPVTGGATQYYKLVVQLEKSSSTTVVGAIVNRTIADVDNDARTIVANLPNAEITDGVNENVTL